MRVVDLGTTILHPQGYEWGWFKTTFGWQEHREHVWIIKMRRESSGKKSEWMRGEIEISNPNSSQLNLSNQVSTQI